MNKQPSMARAAATALWSAAICACDGTHLDFGASEPSESVVMPVIRSQPQPLSVAVGQAARFSVTAEGRGPLRYQWRRDGIDVSGATDPTLTLATTRPADQARYSVLVSNGFADIVSGSAQLQLGPVAQSPP